MVRLFGTILRAGVREQHDRVCTEGPSKLALKQQHPLVKATHANAAKRT